MAINKLRGTKNVDGTAIVTPSRTGAYSEAYSIPVMTGRMALADEGSYYVAQNATVGTQLTGHVAPAIADTNTKSIIHFYNGGLLDVYLDYLTLTTVVANASATAVDFLAWTDNKGATGLTSGGTAITTIANTRSNSTNTSGITLTAGACITAPVTNVKRVLQRVVKPYIGVALDSYSFVFGNGAWAPTGYALITAVTHTLTSCAPVVVGPGGNFYFVQTGPSGATTAMTFEFELGFYER
jgi:hypothetical protein